MKFKFPLSGVGIVTVAVIFLTAFLMGFSSPSQAKNVQDKSEFPDTATIVYPGYAKEPIDVVYLDERPIAIIETESVYIEEVPEFETEEIVDVVETTVDTESIIVVCLEETDQPKISYTEDDLDLFARLLTAEVGSTWIPDEIQLYVGSVVLNRMAHEYFPDTLYDVIYQPGQYSPTWNGRINNTPDERTIENARKLLEEGSVLPANVVFQANFKQGEGIHYKYYDEILGTTTYFCYASN